MARATRHPRVPLGVALLRSKPRTSDDARLEDWTRREAPMLELLPYGLLAVCMLISVIVRGPSEALAVDLTLSALAGLWILWMVTLHPAWIERPRVMTVFFLGLFALMAALVIRQPFYGFFAWSGFLFVFRIMPYPWRLAGTSVVAVILGTSQNGGLPGDGAGSAGVWLALITINLVVAGLMNWLTEVGELRAEQHRRTIDELTEANERLEASLRENAELHARLVAQARQTGVQDERQRMAREIHDTLAQGLAGIITQLQAAERTDRDDPAWRRHATAATTLARESLSEARRSVQALRPESLESARLPEALSDVVARWSSLHDVPVQVTTTGEPRPMHPEVEVTLLRTAQEALANVAKHARASRVGLTISYMEDLVTLDVRDDGVGFEPGREAAAAAAAGGGFGLTAMRQRVTGLSGTLEIESEPGVGTAISANLPALDVAGPLREPA
jgi:signal transduction histidine kinase